MDNTKTNYLTLLDQISRTLETHGAHEALAHIDAAKNGYDADDIDSVMHGLTLGITALLSAPPAPACTASLRDLLIDFTSLRHHGLP
jgi:hypothetical protein